MIIQNGIVLLCATVLLSACGTSAIIQKVEEKTANITFDANASKPLQFKKVVIKLNRGEHIGAIQAGVFCAPNGDLTWKGGRADVNPEEFNSIFIEEVTKVGLKTVGNPDALFEDPEAAAAEILVAGTIKSLKANFCFPYAGFGNFTSSKGEAQLTVDWQIFSKLDRRVVYVASTQGSFTSKDTSPDGAKSAVFFAFAQATRNLLGDQKFTALLSQSGRLLTTAESSVKGETLKLSSRSALIATSPKDFGLAVGTVFAGNGHGSGFFISDTGHMLTNYHVVQDAKFIKIRGQDGAEYLGEVLRRNPARDVALLKISVKPTYIFKLQDNIPNPGDKVFAVGSPLDPRLGASVSAGIVSSVRISDNQRYIQSDVNVLPGNSGGPLLNEVGQVLGITTSGYQISGAPTGINLFGPSVDLKTSLGFTVD